MVVAAVIASAVLGTIIWVVDDAARTTELAVWIARVWFVTAIWLIGWPVWGVTVSFLVRGEEPDDALRGRSAGFREPPRMTRNGRSPTGERPFASREGD